jgi:two-component system LytT family sensor kinase
VTEDVNLPRTRRVFVAAAAAFTAIGLLRGSVQVFIDPRDFLDTLYRYRVTTLISWFWVPVAIAIAATWRWRGDPKRFVLAQLALIAITVPGEVAWMGFVVHRFAPRLVFPPFTMLLVGRLDTNLLMYFGIVGAVWAAESLRRESATRLAAAKLDGLLADTRLHVLTLQLHPHFLFNTLNLISQLAYRDAAAARRTLGNLRDLLMQALTHAGSRDVPLREELEFLSAYLEIQQRRFGERLRVTVNVEAEALEAAVPHLLLQPLVENAIIHGLANRPEGGSLNIAGRVANGRLTLVVEDDGVGLGASAPRERVGLTNTRLRLQQCSSDDCRFTIAARSPRGTTVTIDIPARPAREPSTIAEPPNAAGDEEDTHDAKVDHPRRASRLMLCVQFATGWIAVAALWTELSVAQQVVRHVPVVWGPAIVNSASNALILCVLTPVVLWLARRFDLLAARSWRRVATHVLAAGALAVTHIALLLAFLHQFVPSQYDIERGNMFAWGVWDIVAYATVVAFGAVARLARTHRDALVAMTATRSRIAKARLASLRLRLQPAVLVRGLDAIGAAMSVDPGRAEHAIARMGDLLRALLARVDRESAPLDVELATLRAFVDVIDANARVTASDDIADAIVPAILLTPLAAALDQVTTIDVFQVGETLEARLHARGSAVDEAQIAQIRDRLRRRYRAAAMLSVSADSAGAVVELRLPLERATTSDDDEPSFEPALVVA